MQIDRRSWLKAAGGAVGIGFVPGTSLAQGDVAAQADGGVDWLASFPRQASNLVRETVGASHGRFERVRELVTAYPELAKGSWDWGFGDWESPIEAAGHTGQREIALFLIEHGARPNLFTHAMLGDVDVVKTTVTAQPNLLKTPGPHGLSLMHHAKTGGDQSAAVLEFLKSRGAEDTASTVATAEQAEATVGEYRAEGPGPRFWIEAHRRGLAIRGETGSQQLLYVLGDGSWHPAGAPSVRLRFSPVDGKVSTVAITMGGKSFKAMRI